MARTTMNLEKMRKQNARKFPDKLVILYDPFGSDYVFVEQQIEWFKQIMQKKHGDNLRVISTYLDYGPYPKKRITVEAILRSKSVRGITPKAVVVDEAVSFGHPVGTIKAITKDNKGLNVDWEPNDTYRAFMGGVNRGL